MTRYFNLTLLFLAFFFVAAGAFAQKKDSTYVGEVNGLVKDSVHNYVLQSATISVYRAGDSRLLSYQLSNNFGRFSFKELPVGIRLKVVVSYIGYQTYGQEFVIPTETPKVVFKPFHVLRSSNELKEVSIVAKPPMQMKGDTLEFNADAFSLDTNAVVEDLLRKLPGVTIWGDGLITVNGKKVSNVYVDGKPFFGSDPKMALQNLPKNAIEKIQIYKEPKKEDADDPATNMNIVLKDGKKTGMFGKIGGGYGTTRRYSGDGMLSAFSPKTQISVVGSTNNVNKAAYDIATLMSYSSFKGEGIGQNYQPDFRKQGLNVFNSAGFTYAHDFVGIQSPQYNKSNLLKGDYFFNNAGQEVLKGLQTVVSLNDNQQLIQDNAETSTFNGFTHRANGSYDYKSEHSDFNADFSLQRDRNKGTSSQDQHSLNTSTFEESRNITRQESDNWQHSTNLKAAYASRTFFEKNKMKSVSFNIDYAYNRNTGENNSLRTTDFTSITNPLKNQYFNRKYESNFDRSTHTSNFSTPNLIRLFKKNTRGSRLELKNAFSWYRSKLNENVSDLDTLSGRHTNNGFLTNNGTYNLIDEKPGLSFNRSFEKALDNRYRKTLSLNVTAQARFSHQKNRSDKAFQKIDRSYADFLPSASISYRNAQAGEYEQSYGLSYSTSTGFPGIDQLVPLVDSANVYVLNLGNTNLKSTYKHELALSFSRFTVAKNSFNWNARLKAGIIDRYIADSSNYDALGRNVHYFVNGSGNRYAEFYSAMGKVVKVSNHQFQLSMENSLNYSINPAYVNDEAIRARNLNGTQSLGLYYSFKDILNANVGQSLYTFSTRRKNAPDFSNRSWSTTLAAGVNLPKKIYVSSNINFNRSISSFSEPVNYTIWNASAGCRFMKGNNAELKFSALDLLHQNTSVVNYGSNNSITRGTVNVLQQYFMVTLSYYPRKFGKSDKK